MSKKSWKGKAKYNKRKNVHSVRPPEKIAQTTAVMLQSSIKTTLPKPTATTKTKTFGDYKDVYTEIKRIGILFVIIIAAIIVVWLILR